MAMTPGPPDPLKQVLAPPLSEQQEINSRELVEKEKISLAKDRAKLQSKERLELAHEEKITAIENGHKSQIEVIEKTHLKITEKFRDDEHWMERERDEVRRKHDQVQVNHHNLNGDYRALKERLAQVEGFNLYSIGTGIIANIALATWSNATPQLLVLGIGICAAVISAAIPLGFGKLIGDKLRGSNPLPGYSELPVPAVAPIVETANESEELIG